MKKHFLLIAAALLLCMTNAFSKESVERQIQQLVSFGEWQGLMPEGTPTHYKNYFYDSQNRIVGTVHMNPHATDSYTTVECERRGEVTPDYMTYYVYNEKGNLIEKKLSRFMVHEGQYRSWTNWKTQETFEYNENNQVSIHKMINSSTEYKYEGNNVIEEVHNIKGSWNKTTRFFNFVEGKENLPQLAIITHSNESQNRIEEYKYNAQGVKIEYTSYTIEEGSIKKDANGIITEAKKGIGVRRYVWTYTENILNELNEYFWDNGNNKWVPELRTEYINSENEIKEKTLSYNPTLDTWGEYNTIIASRYVNYDTKTAAKNTKINVFKDKTNSFKVSADLPSKIIEGAKWYLMCNGNVVGEAITNGSKIEYTVNEVRNGQYIYFFQQIPDKSQAHAGYNISNPVEIEFNTELQAPQNLKATQLPDSIIGQGPSKRVITRALLTWDKPNTKYEVEGYNVYTDIKSSDTNPFPINLDNEDTSRPPIYSLIKDTQCIVEWEFAYGEEAHALYVQASYKYGLCMSVPVALVANSEAVKDTQEIYILDENNKRIAVEKYEYTFKNNLAFITRFKIDEKENLIPETYTVLHYGGRKMHLDSISRYTANNYGYYTEWENRELLWTSKDEKPFSEVIKIDPKAKTEVIENYYHAESAPEKLGIMLLKDTKSDYEISCTAGVLDFGAKKYNVYRNGIIIGQTEPVGTRVKYIDKNVPNGDWYYSIKADVKSDNCALNISNTASIKVNNKQDLKAVTKIEEVENGKDANGDWILKIKWSAPTENVKGYNVYADPKDAKIVTVPENGIEKVVEPTYTFNCNNDSIQKVVCVEALYTEGRVKSENVTFIIMKDVAVDNVENETIAVIVRNDMLNIATGKEIVSANIYSINGAKLIEANTSNVNISNLPKGIYLINIQLENCNKTIKFAK